MVSAIIFLGPTMAHGQAAALLDATYLPPAAQGDVYRAALRRPRVIGLVDGLFEHVPSVWHKEILWAMEQGIHVFGAASMGALRAAELVTFGMEGVGAIYEAYASGELEDDDAVAVAHGPAENGYRLLSEALVNIQTTLAAAERAGVIGAGCAARLRELARATFYAERGYPRLLADAEAAGLPAAELDTLRDWLPAGRVDQKRADAIALLDRVGALLGADPEPKQVSYYFERTVFWERARRGAAPSAGAEPDLLQATLLDELRLDPPRYQSLRATALAHGLARAMAEGHDYAAHPDEVRQESDDLRLAAGLARGADFRAWLEARGLSSAEMVGLMTDRTLLTWAAGEEVPNAAARIVAELRLAPDFPQLARRAEHKQRALAAAGLDAPSLTDSGVSREELLRWFFEELAGRAVPGDIWLYARACGYKGAGDFIRAVLREYHYLRSCGEHIRLTSKEEPK